ncbi:LemA family protein [Planctomycetota bacterium]
MDSARVLDAFYPGASTARNQVKRARRLWSAMRSEKEGHKSPRKKWITYLVVGSLAVAVWVVVHLYYYNMLVDLECNVLAGWAQVEVQLQRRYHIQQNLTQIVMDYSKYEKDTLTGLIEMRTSAVAGERTAKATDGNRGSPSPLLGQLTKSELTKLFPDVMLTAEQYPELKLTENFQQFSTAVVDNENQIAEQTMAYNEAVNIYTTVRTQFPGNIFGPAFGFPMYDFYEPNEELLDFKPVNY